MSQLRQFLIVIATAIVFASAASHVLARWLRLNLSPMESRHCGPESTRTPIAVAGSSLTFFAVNWNGLGARFGRRIDTFACATASPCEIEAMPFGASPGALRVIGISIYEMNEKRLSNARPELVPLWQTIADLRASGMDWDYCKKALSQYPESYARKVFPTAGYSGAVMVGLRDKVRQLAHRGPQTGLSIHGGDTQAEHVTDWDAGRVARNVSSMRAFGGNREVFGGPKWQALVRLTASASPKHPLVVLVLPVSPFYRSEVGTPAGQAAFDAQLKSDMLQRPGLHVLRADCLPEVDDGTKFCDLVHMNLEGRALLTPHVEALLTPLLMSP